MPQVVLDSDFLSSFLKIEQLPLVREVFQVPKLILPGAVYREVAVTSLLTRLTTLGWLEVRDLSATQVGAVSSTEDFVNLGAGEKEAIALAYDLEEAVLLMNDRQASRVSRALSIATLNIPAFLLLYRNQEDGSSERLRELVRALEEKDRFGFSERVLRLLFG